MIVKLTTAEALHLNEINYAREAYAKAFCESSSPGSMWRPVRHQLRRACLSLKSDRKEYLRVLAIRRITREERDGMFITRGTIAPKEGML